jgi:hypothetical protein
MTNDFKTDHLNEEQKKIAAVMVKVAGKGASGGGCPAFYTPEQWKERGETYGTESKLIVCHDGGDLAKFCNFDYCQYAAMDRMSAALGKIGYYVENCTSWYSAVYRNSPENP